ncbi:MAG: cobalt transporter CbiM [Candidatus Syntrophonatronum acetioxidans]|uniref:Cobalt transporter CbiM n=1 Tax=Candidatus Syntrophonatronum acetioxidans TaxID=1795816 RepID=A0A424YGP6_9FIRM|nr:MAG: cobalt transporter CbiM [Candidatus Syntrophonatronum acetioxidans]
MKFKEVGVLHLADGVLSMPVVGVTYAAAGALTLYSAWGIKEEEVPKVSLMSGGFFALSLLSIPVGPSSVHPMLAGLMGVVLGRRATLAFLVALLLQAILFQHGGLTTLGANTLLLAIPALLAYGLFYRMENKSVFFRGVLAGVLGVAGTVIFLILLLLLTDPRFGEGLLSVINILVLGHVPLAVVEGLVTGFALRLLYNVRPALLGITFKPKDI